MIIISLLIYVNNKKWLVQLRKLVIFIFSKLLKVEYLPSVLLLFGLLFCFILIFDLTRKISKLHHQLVTLTQDYALLKQKLKVKDEE
ncbi:DUF2304 family protein [Bacillus sp. H1a]|nr:DUF2304 family protein [Bacillus sp. H1a]